MATYTPNLNLGKPEATDPFGNFRALFNDNMDKLDNGGGGGHTIVDPNGTDLPQEAKLQFTGAVSVTDDNVNGATVVDVIGGGNGLILNADIYSTDEQVIGVWTNKKPLYQKTIISDVSQSTGAVTIATGISNVEEIIQTFGSASYGSNDNWTFLPFDDDSNQTNISNSMLKVRNFNRNNGNLALYIGSDYNGQYKINKIRITLQYTKTTDTAGSGGFQAYGFSPIIYSDVERVVGVWRDNKPLYQKSITVNSVNLPANDGVDVLLSDYGINDVEKIIDIKGRDETVNAYIPYLGQGGNTLYLITISSDNPLKLRISRNGGAISNQTFVITLQYTKTTDVAGSGDYTTLGIPTHHYSTNEQVIGTWIDGKPLYERTKVVPFANFTHNNDTYFTPIVSDNTETLRNVEAIAYSTGYGVCTLGSRAYSRDNTLSYYWELVAYYSNVALHFVGESATDIGVTEVVITYRYTKTTD